MDCLGDHLRARRNTAGKREVGNPNLPDTEWTKYLEELPEEKAADPFPDFMGWLEKSGRSGFQWTPKVWALEPKEAKEE